MALSPAQPFGVARTEPRLEGLHVFVRALRVEAEIGVYAHEKGRTQPLVLDIELTLDPHTVGGIGDTVNYETLVAKTKTLVAEGHIDLVEHFAQRLALACLEPVGVTSVRVRVEKPEALAADAAAAGVEVIVSRR